MNNCIKLLNANFHQYRAQIHSTSYFQDAYFEPRWQRAHEFDAQAQANHCCHAAMLNSRSECDPEAVPLLVR